MRFQVYVTRQLLTAFLFAVGGLLFVALPGIVVSAVHKLPNVEPLLLLRYLPLVLQTLAPYVLPLCFMLAAVAVYGRLAADREWIAMQMSGIWPMKLLAPAFALATVLAGATYWMVSEELPQLKQRQKRFLVDATASVIENLQPGKTTIDLPGNFYLRAADVDERTGTFIDVYIRAPENEKLPGDTFASSVDIRVEGDFLYCLLKNPEVFDARGDIQVSTAELEAQINIADAFEKDERDWSKPRYMRSSDIRTALATGVSDPKTKRRMYFELHRRGVMAVAFFLFLGLGVPTGLLLRRGTQLGALAIAAGYGIVYYVFSMRIGKELGLAEGLPAWLGPWSTTLAGSVVALVLLKKAMRR